MAANSEPSEAIGVDELRALETSVLKALCLTINTAGSELKYKILDSLSDDDFYFPIMRSVFQTLSEMHRRGDYVISANLEEELQQAGVPMPAEFSIEQLFSGTLPGLSDLNAWVVRLKERSRSGIIPTVKPPSEAPAAPPASNESSEPPDSTVVRPLSDVKQKIAQARAKEQRKSNPALTAKPPRSSPNVGARPAAPSPKSSPSVGAKPPSQPGLKSSPSVSGAKPAPKAVLSSEGEDWASYLEDLAAKQGKSFETGFSGLDERIGGLSPGLMLLVDEDRDRLYNFLKQTTDQVASGSSIRCLYVAAELPKTLLRLRTLSRLGAVPLRDIERGRLKKDSPEWRRVDEKGRKAAAWLKRVFVHEVEDAIELALIRELVKKLLAASNESTCMIVIDALERIAGRGGSPQVVVSQLKGLADALEILILTATTDPTLLSSKDADYAAVFREARNGLLELEVLQAGRESSTIVTFQYEPEICRFTEM